MEPDPLKNKLACNSTCFMANKRNVNPNGSYLAP